MINDGYYLFIYSEIDPVFNVLNLSLRHDHNLAVFKKENSCIKLICHLEFERFSGIKHHRVAFYNREDACLYINKLLYPYKLTLNDFEGVYGMPGLFNEDNDLSYSSILDVKQVTYHAISHLFTSLILDTDKFYNNDIIALAFDGGSDILLDKDVEDKCHFCGALSRKGNIEYFAISSPGAYWLYVSEYFNRPEGTLMALAYATNARSLEDFKSLPDYLKPSDKTEVINAINSIIDRIMNYTDQDIDKLYINRDERFSDEENKISMIMKVIQELSIKNVFNQIDDIIKKYSLNTKETMISLSGGYALNCPTNTCIMEKYNFKEQLCVPCVNDGGLAIGMGLYFFHKNCERFTYKFDNAFYGYMDKIKIDDILSKYSYYIKSVENGLDHVAEDIEAAPIVWVDGKSEIGPRALGHRSIIANPMKISHKDLLNKYKQREWWRPVAPIVLEEDLDNWFAEAFESPYMLNNFKAKPEAAVKIPAALHFDGSARVQSISGNDDYDMYKVISKFKSLTGVPIVCNTSLNDKGEPIINTIEQAFNFALRKNIEIVYAYGNRICLKNHRKYEEEKYLRRDDEVFYKHLNDKERILTEANPYNVPMFDFIIYLYNPSLRKYHMTNKEDVNKLKRILTKLKKISKDLKTFKILENEVSAYYCNTKPSEADFIDCNNWLGKSIEEMQFTSKEISMVSEPSIDLHIHTNASDGTDSPGEVIKNAVHCGLAAIAITDHDTITGIKSAMSEAGELGIELVPGAEFSANFNPVMHILGLYIDIDNKSLITKLEKIKKIRMKLLTKALKLANDYGVNVTLKELLATKKTITIVNLKEYLLESNLIENKDELDSLFRDILNEWKSCLPSPAECISLIHSWNGVAILAHPRLLSNDDEQLVEILTKLKSYGLDGIEVIHPSHTNEDKLKLMKWADQLGLLCSGGSDYHGKDDHYSDSIGKDAGDRTAPYSCLEKMKLRIKGR
ncbi:carbamoyltransferase C-terminal domain-containing protein [Clostridium beijerinckii]|uniref:carbamoyltransferase C-terminal domain-containing protein n=1 Tax=Clostridium beijerinckii TaxID=1520 RepID=UPI0022E30346|nr:carbamoyltransferase C-terminal domain-containing protein [Clostridium beijerinckii]